MSIHFIGNFSKKQQKKIKKALISLKRLYKTKEFSIVKNPENIYPPYDIYPLADKINIDSNFSVILTDMDGTTTSTEVLCLHSLEFMMKSITSKNFSFENSDYPHIIGNSTTKHVEYLLDKYSKLINLKSLKEHSERASLWTLKNSKDKKRKKEAEEALKILKTQGSIEKNFSLEVKLAIEIYYSRYHSILEKIKKGRGKELSKKLTGGKPLIAPMPGIPLFLSLLKGVLKSPPENFSTDKKTALEKIIRFFANKKIKIALVTSSIFYEADIVLTEVFKKIREEIKKWAIKETEKKRLLKVFSSYTEFYDTIVTADNSHEIRLKPHRDLYSIALFNMNIPQKNFCQAIGFEDSISGILALRAAGIGKVVAVPFKESSTHNLTAASLICKRGVNKFIFKHLASLV